MTVMRNHREKVKKDLTLNRQLRAQLQKEVGDILARLKVNKDDSLLKARKEQLLMEIRNLKVIIDSAHSWLSKSSKPKVES